MMYCKACHHEKWKYNAEDKVILTGLDKCKCRCHS